MNCGTPIGRLIDEAGDAIQYSWGWLIFGYGLRVPPGVLNYVIAMSVMPMYTIEMKFIMTGKLDLTAGADDLGPVELELIFSILFVLMGICGTSGQKKSITEHFEFLPESFECVKLNQICLAFGSIFVGLFVIENLAYCFGKDLKKAMWILISPLILLAEMMI